MDVFSRNAVRKVISDDVSSPIAPQFPPDDCFAAISALPGVVIYQRLVTPDGQIRYTYISENAYDLFGVSAEEIISDPHALFSCHSSDYSAKFRERLLAASEGLMIWDVEASIVSRDGQKKYTHAIARPDRKPDGSVLWTGIILDETRTRTALLESLSQGMLIFDADDRLILRNNSFLELFPFLQNVAVPGARYEDIVKEEVSGGQRWLIDDPEKFDSALYRDFLGRMDRHREPHSMYERQIGDDRWLLVTEQRSGRGTVVLFAEITQIKRGERQIRHLAYHDALTGLSNRTIFHQRIEEALAQASERRHAVAVLCLDLDQFKNVNDTLGHPAGDLLLKIVAARLRSCLRDTDTVARLGGDEFGIVVTDLPDLNYVTALAWRLLDVISDPADLDGHQALTTASIGIAVAGADAGPDQLLKNADLALYRAKADGRATFRFFEAEMDARAQERRTMEMDLRHAVARGQLELHYQAQVSLYTDQILGFEALVRWHHPERGLIPPADFIPLAEETGLIVRVGEWVIQQACADAARWPKPVRIAVNVSPAQFKGDKLVGVIARALNDCGLTPDRLEIEITESLLLCDATANLRTLKEIKALGVHISMDDFGTGYSSLQNLRSFPFDKIKIDRSFVGDLERRPDAPAIVRAVLGLGQSLGMVTCAEGVETEQQLIYLRDQGCLEVQGFYYSEPKPAHEAIRLLKEGFSGTASRRPQSPRNIDSAANSDRGAERVATASGRV